MFRAIATTLLCAIALCILTIPASAAVSRVQVASYSMPADGTSLTCSLTSAPTPGDLLVQVLAWNSNATITTPSGWTVLGSQLNSALYSTVEVIYRIAQTGDGTSYTSTLSASSGGECVFYEFSGVNTSAPFVGSAFAAQNNVTTASITSSPTGSPAYPIAVFFTRSQLSAFTVTSPWVQDQFIGNWGGLQTQDEGQVSGGSVTASAGLSGGSYLAESLFFVNPAASSAQDNGLSLLHAGGPHQSIAVSFSSQVPALLPWETYIGFAVGNYDSMDHISASNAQKWCDYAQASTETTTSVSGGDTGGANGSDCRHAYAYSAVNMFQPTTSGTVNTFPWTGSYTGSGCPASYKASKFAETTGTDAPNWTSSSPSQNWFMYEVPSGGTYGSDADRIQGFYNGNTYTFFTNLASTSLQQSIQDAYQSCSSGGQPIDTYYEGMWNDNGYMGLQNNPNYAWVVWWGEGEYDQKINWGIVNGTPYTGSACNGGPSSLSFWNGSQCSVSSQIDSVPITSGNTTYGADTGTGTNKTSTPILGWQSMMSSVHHANGSLIDWQFNGLLNGYAACEVANKEPNVTGGFDEEAVIRGSQDDGRLQLDSTLQNIIDVASDDYACGGKATFFIHDYLATRNAYYYNGGTLTTVTNGAVVGTPTEQEDLRAHFYMIWLLANDAQPTMVGSMTHACDNSVCSGSYNSWTDVWPADFAVPSGRITPYPSEALGNGQYCSDSTAYDHNGTNQLCTQGGAHDSSICATGTAPNCVFVAEYSHFWVWDYSKCSSGPDQTTWQSCAKDIGPFVVLYNLSGSSKTLSSSNLSSWLGSEYSALNYMLWPGCQPASSAYGSTAGSTIYPGDNGGASASSPPSTTNVCNGSTAADVYYGGRMGAVQVSLLNISSASGPTLPDGESIGFTAATP